MDQKARAREQNLAAVRRYNQRHPDRYLFNSARKRAKRDGTPFTITLSDVVIPTHCPVLGIELKVGHGNGRQGGYSDSMSLDRIHNSKGYVPGNVQVISNLANSMKSCATPDQLTRFAEWVLSAASSGLLTGEQK